MDSRKPNLLQQDVGRQPTSCGGPEVWFRYYEVCYSAGSDEWGDPLPGIGRIAVELMEIPVIRRTPCGAWVGYYEDDKKFVNLSWNKCFALPTKREAMVSFIARKRRQKSIHERRAALAGRVLDVALRMAVE